MIWLCVTPEREYKTGRLMGALRDGCPHECKVIVGAPPDDGQPFIVWGQALLGFDLVSAEQGTGRAFWHIDNGYVNSARGSATGYYRITYRGLAPVLLRKPVERLGRYPAIRDWRSGGRYILLAHPGMEFGKAIGLDMGAWLSGLDLRTDRTILHRPKGAHRPLEQDLAGAWALVTHSSTVAVDAARYGVPIFVALTNPAAPVGRHDLEIDEPIRPDRAHWWRSLLCQQYTLDEMRDGTAWRLMELVKEQVDAGHL